MFCLWSAIINETLNCTHLWRKVAMPATNNSPTVDWRVSTQSGRQARYRCKSSFALSQPDFVFFRQVWVHLVLPTSGILLSLVSGRHISPSCLPKWNGGVMDVVWLVRLLESPYNLRYNKAHSRLEIVQITFGQFINAQNCRSNHYRYHLCLPSLVPCLGSWVTSPLDTANTKVPLYSSLVPAPSCLRLRLLTFALLGFAIQPI